MDLNQQQIDMLLRKIILRILIVQLTKKILSLGVFLDPVHVRVTAVKLLYTINLKKKMPTTLRMITKYISVIFKDFTLYCAIFKYTKRLSSQCVTFLL